METEALAQDFEPWSPGFHARDAPPWDDTNDNSQQPFGSKEMSRRTISTIDMLSPRRHSESFEPWSPGFQFHSKVDPWETKDDSQKSRMCEDFEPWSPGFQFHSKGDPWDDETNETNETNDDVNKPRMAKDIFRNTLSTMDTWSAPGSPREPCSPGSPTLFCNPWLSQPASPIVAPTDPWGESDDLWISPPGTPREFLVPGSETVSHDPWADVDKHVMRIKHVRPWYSKAGVWIIAFLISTCLIHSFDAKSISKMLRSVTYEYVLFSAALSIFCACKLYSSSRSSDAEACSPRSPSAAGGSPRTPLHAKHVSVFGFFEAMLSAQFFWQEMTFRLPDQNNIFAMPLSFGKEIANRLPLNTDVFSARFSDALTHLPAIQQFGLDAASKHMENMRRLTSIAGFDMDTASKQLEIITQPVRNMLNMAASDSAITPLERRTVAIVKKQQVVGHPRNPVFMGYREPGLASMPAIPQPSPELLVYPRGCHVTHICLGGRFEVMDVVEDWLQLRNVKTFEEELYPKTQLKKMASQNLAPRPFLIAKLKDGHRDGMDSRAYLHLGWHFSILAQLAYSDLPADHPNAQRAGNLFDEYFGDLSGCAEVLKYDREVVVYYVHEKSLQALKFENKNEIVIVVRGTVPEPLSKGTWFGPNVHTDADVQPAFDPRYGVVHNGFLDASKKFWCETDLASFLGNHRKHNRPPKRVYFVGHSLGGALAMLFARYCRDDPNVNYPPKRLEIHTFGAPHVFLRPRNPKIHKQVAKDKDDFLAAMRVHHGLVDWDPRRQREPVKIHHERWVNDDDRVPHFCDSLFSKLFLSGKEVVTRFTWNHIDEQNSLSGKGHGVMFYVNELKKRASRESVNTERISVELKKSASQMVLSSLATKRSKKWLFSKHKSM